MQAAGAVTSFALDAFFTPRADDAGQIALIAGRLVAGSVARTAGVFEILDARAVLGPAGVLARRRVGKVPLVQVIRVANGSAGLVGDDKALLVHKAILPIVTADNVRNVVPGITFGQFVNRGERHRRRFAIYNLV